MGQIDVNLFLIDPKMLELSTYEGIPHLLCPVITEAKRAASVLGWVVKEMESRYRLMTRVGVRNIDGYNSKHKLSMPYIVVIVDEMSDLMLVAGKEIEGYIQKLSQMARAAGITYNNGHSKTKCRRNNRNNKSKFSN